MLPSSKSSLDGHNSPSKLHCFCIDGRKSQFQSCYIHQNQVEMALKVYEGYAAFATYITLLCLIVMGVILQFLDFQMPNSEL